jgi:monofunctional biosynthetic peptidoglycan transglycosylase
VREETVKRRRRRAVRAPARRRLVRLLGVAVLALGMWLAWEAWTWPDVAALAERAPRTTAFIEQWRAEQRAAGRRDDVAWSWVPYAAISPHLKRAVLVAEDINFFSHRGFDLEEMREAVGEAVAGRELPRGASTITQQLAKNLWLSPSRSPLRKIREALLTRQLERTLDKRRILELYLNVAELGPGVYGVGAASRRYFDKPAADLDEREAALLAAALPRPRRWHPGVASAAYHRHASTIEHRMDRARFLWRLL